MNRYFISLAYKGTNFHGWQSQDNAKSIQSEIECCLSLVLRENIKITGCGRTDAGVHAAFYVAHFDYRTLLDETQRFNLIRKMNLFIPNAIVLFEIIPVNNELNSRFHATKRTYKYFISKSKNPFISDYSVEYKNNLNLKLMELACKIIKKYSDFTSFSKTGGNSQTNLCKIYDAKWDYYEDAEILVFTISADRFLRNMVRAIVGTLMEVGREKINLEEFRKIIESKNRSNAGPSVDAKGLFLWDIEYDNIVLNKPKNNIFQIKI